MKLTVKVLKEVEVQYLKVDAGVRDWDGADVNGVEDVDGIIPCREGDRWQPLINLKTGQITNWDKGTTAEVYYKVVDDGSYYLTDAGLNIVAAIEEDYVPKMLCPKEKGYGDYIIMDIDENGFIADFKPNFEAFEPKIED